MCSTQTLQLQQMLHPAQEPVGGGQVGCLVAANVAAAGQRGERREGGGAAQALVGAPVHQLQQLHRELDIAQPARTELELASCLPTRHRVLDAAAHRLHILDKIVALRRLPHQWRHHLDIPGTELEVARDGPGLQQCLELPRLRPTFVVGAVAGERPHQGAASPLRAQVRVHLPERRFGRAL